MGTCGRNPDREAPRRWSGRVQDQSRRTRQTRWTCVQPWTIDTGTGKLFTVDFLTVTTSLSVCKTGFTFVQHLCGFLGQYWHLEFCFYCFANATDDHKYSLFPSKILLFLEFW